MLFGIQVKGKVRLLRAARKESLTVDLFTVADIAKVPTVPGNGKTCPPPTYAGVLVLKVNGSVRLMLADESTIEVPIAQIGGIRTKNRVAVPA